MKRFWLAWLLPFVAVGAVAGAQVRDPLIRWRTLTTPHFHVHYYEPLGYLARRTAAALEQAHTRVHEIFGSEPQGRVHVVVSDDSDFANGSATAYPYDVIRVYAEAPEDLTALNEYDDWVTGLVSHEHTHILHLDQARGFPAFVNAILGRVYLPNHLVPRWMLEGIAVWQETEVTSGGRLRSSMWDMQLRADFVAERMYSLDQLTSGADRWPHGNDAYLYGSHFIRYIADHHGRLAIAAMAHDYAGATIPYGLNRMALRHTGKTLIELYDAFLEERRGHYQQQLAALTQEHPLVQGSRLTTSGENTRAPRYYRGQLYYFQGDNRSRGRIMTWSGQASEFVRANGGGEVARDMHGNAYFSRIDGVRDVYRYSDLFVRDRDGDERRLTHGLRAREPDVTPDGSKIAFVTSAAGMSHLWIADPRDIEHSRHELLRHEDYTQIYAPRFRSDGGALVVSVWRPGGMRDIALIDLATEEVTYLTHDRALETGPVFSPSGDGVYFSSDRTGIANIYFFDLHTNTLEQVTHESMGAYQPAVSPDETTLVYTGYTTYGFDLFSMPLARADFFEPLSAREPSRTQASDTTPVFDGLSDRYDPLPTLWPRNYLLDATPDSFGTALGISIAGTDAAEVHAYNARFGVGVVRGNLSADLNYTYQGSPLHIDAALFRHTSRVPGFIVGGRELGWIQNATGGNVGVSYNFPHSYYHDEIGLRYAGTFTEPDEPLQTDWDPNTFGVPRFPLRGYFSTIQFSYSYSDIERYAYDISANRGRSFSLGGSVSHPSLGSVAEVYSLTWSLSQYVPMPWSAQHVLAFRYGGGVSTGSTGQVFAIGGYPQVAAIEGLIDGGSTSGIALRGYPVNDRVGNQLHLAQLEYRFPIVRFNAGAFTLPVYVNRLYGVIFADGGDAFSRSFDINTFRVGAGAQLQLDMTFFYYVGVTLRVGYARGFMERGTDQFYLNFGAPF